MTGGLPCCRNCGKRPLIDIIGDHQRYTISCDYSCNQLGYLRGRWFVLNSRRMERPCTSAI